MRMEIIFCDQAVSYAPFLRAEHLSVSCFQKAAKVSEPTGAKYHSTEASIFFDWVGFRKGLPTVTLPLGRPLVMPSAFVLIARL